MSCGVLKKGFDGNFYFEPNFSDAVFALFLE
jgi:hypothetical protein